MKKISLALIAGALGLASTPVFAGHLEIASVILAGPFATHTDCAHWAPWKENRDRKDWTAAYPDMMKELRCQMINGQYYVVYG
jgi:hypothetical protein